MPIRGDRLRWPPRPGKRSNTPRDGRSAGTRETLATDEDKPAPRQPTERDQSPDSPTSPPRDVIRRAHDDVTSGQVDTDCRNEAVEIVERNEKGGRKP